MWKFTELRQGEPERDPHEAEFFRLTNATEAIVREFIQNSLDAKRRDSNKVRVRFILREVDGRILDTLLGEEFKKHIRACGIRDDEYNNRNSVPYMAIEDFGTTGLDGQTGEDLRPTNRQNFYNFWWCEGKSSKKGQEAGRWGLGKTTFHMASNLRAFWGLTVRHDDGRKLLMGKALLKCHRLNDRTYHYYAYYVDDRFRPIEDAERISKITRTFRLSRGNEPGFSLIIPMPHGEIDRSSVVRSAIYHYFYAIMTGQLEIEIEDEDGTVQLQSDNLIQCAEEEDWEGTDWKHTNVRVFLNFIQKCIATNEWVELPESCAESLVIDESSFGDSINQSGEDFQSGELVAFRVPVYVEKVGRGRERSFFYVYLQRDGTLKKSQEYYVRSGITVVDASTPKSRPVRALFIAQDSAINAFLGDCETPAHTQWNDKTEGFKEKYSNAVPLLRFIKKSVENLVNLLDLPPKERQKDFLKDIFYIIRPVDVPEEEESAKETDIPPIERRPTVFRITRLEDGVRLNLARREKELPAKGVLKLAYDVRRGNPFKQYEPSDFDLSTGAIRIANSGCSISSATRNIVEFEVTNSDFSLEIRGFDTKRDLVVHVREVAYETQS